jgi:putative oxidoreductase
MPLLTRDDFRIKACNFNITHAENLLRVACGAFMFPHALSRFAAFGVLSAGTIGFFGKAGFQPPELWAWLAAFTDAACGIARVLGLRTRYAALGAATAPRPLARRLFHPRRHDCLR